MTISLTCLIDLNTVYGAYVCVYTCATCVGNNARTYTHSTLLYPNSTRINSTSYDYMQVNSPEHISSIFVNDVSRLPFIQASMSCLLSVSVVEAVLNTFTAISATALDRQQLCCTSASNCTQKIRHTLSSVS